MQETPPLDWRGLIRAPIARGLALSAALHLALVALIQPAPGSGRPRTVVISARLLTAVDQPEPGASQPPSPPVPPESPSPDEIGKAPTPVPPAPAEARREILASEVPAPVKVPAAETPPAAPPAQTPHTVAPAAPEAAATPPAAVSGNPGSAPGSGDASNGLGPSLGIDTTWYLARQVDTHPVAIDRITPAYPEEARRRNQEGNVKLMLKIDDLGRVRDVEVVEAMPPGLFDESALAAFRAARFRPAMRDGRPVRYQAYIRVDFKLRD